MSISSTETGEVSEGPSMQLTSERSDICMTSDPSFEGPGVLDQMLALPSPDLLTPLNTKLSIFIIN